MKCDRCKQDADELIVILKNTHWLKKFLVGFNADFICRECFTVWYYINDE